jgi:thiol-disulfide isomerase/thioredoxin
VLCSACEDRPAAKLTSIRSRVDAVKADPADPAESLASFCDATPAAGERSFAYPELASTAPEARAAWRWINVWATWCIPCLEEMPFILRLAKELDPVDLVLLSVDDGDEVVAKYRERHPELPAGPRLKDIDALESWLLGLGLDRGAAIPINVFVDPMGSVRCVRAGGIAEHHRPTIERMVTGAGSRPTPSASASPGSGGR